MIIIIPPGGGRFEPWEPKDWKLFFICLAIFFTIWIGSTVLLWRYFNT